MSGMRYSHAILFMLIFFTCSVKAGAQRGSRPQYYANLGVSREVDRHPSYMMAIESGREFKLKKGFTFAPELNLYKFWDSDYSTMGLGLRPSIHYNFLRRRTFELFVEMKGGIMYMFPQYAGTAVNFTYVTGPGADVHLSTALKLRLSIGYSHFSNGHAQGDATNPTWDGISGCIGLIF